jgi:hypothetical protein
MGGILDPSFKNDLGTEYELAFTPTAPLENVVEDQANLGKDLTKKDHTVVVGGPGNKLSLLTRKGHQLHCQEDGSHQCHICWPSREVGRAVDEQEG